MNNTDEAIFARLMPLTHGAIRAIATCEGAGSLIPKADRSRHLFRFKAVADGRGQFERVSGFLGSCASGLGNPDTDQFENSGTRALERVMTWFRERTTRPADDWEVTASVRHDADRTGSVEVRMVTAVGPGWVAVSSWRAPEVSDAEGCRLLNVAMLARTCGANWDEARAMLRKALHDVPEEQPSGPRR